jgi:hypothetical protein
MAAFQKIDTITLVPATPVAKNGTIVFTYPTTSPARAAASYKAASGAKLAARGLQKVFTQGASNFSLSYGATTVTLTNLGETSYPAGKHLTLDIPLADFEDIAVLIDSSGGTASTTIPAQSGAYVQATQANTIASLAAQINLLTVSQNKQNALLRAFELMPV